MRLARGLAVVSVPVSWLVAQSAQAHFVNAQGAGFAAGAAHPFLGLDHLAAMFAVGLWSAQLGGKALWRVPATFVVMMAIGAGLAYGGVGLPSAETGIAASLLVLGLLVASAARLHEAAGMLLVGVFALFHGHVHGAELPEAAEPLGYALGFLTATAALHALGLLSGVALKGHGTLLVRALGVVIAGGGLVLLAG
jgi:urease accessory protein